MTSFRSGTHPLDLLFDPYVEGDKAPITGMRVGGQDLRDRYAPLSVGQRRADVGYRIPGGVDVAALFAAAGTAQYDAVIVPDISVSGSSNAAAAPNGHAALRFNPDGTLTTFTNNPNGVTSTGGRWIIKGSAADFDIFFWLIEGEAEGILPNWLNRWMPMGDGVYYGFDTQSSASAHLGAQIRKRATGKILARGENIYLSARWSRRSDGGGPVME